MDISPTAREQIGAEAVDWFLRFQDSTRTSPDREAFSLWLTRSPAHIEEYLAVSSVWVGLNVASEAEFSTDSLIAAAREAHPDNVVRLATQHVSNGQEPQVGKVRAFGRRRWFGLAASVALGIGAWLGYVGLFHDPVFKTAIGEQRSVSLSDGSLVFLNTNSEVRTRWTKAERHIDLIKGEARFQVAKNKARPFLVFTPDATVRAVGTIFNVRADRSGTEVAVIEGRVKVSALTSGIAAEKGLQDSGAAGSVSLPSVGPAAPPSIELAAGQRAAVALSRIAPGAGRPMESVVAWTERRLVFRNEPLVDAIAEFNRYRAEPLVVDDAQLATLKISGVFDSSDPDSLIEYLKSFETVKVERPRDERLHLSRSTLNPSSPK